MHAAWPRPVASTAAAAATAAATAAAASRCSCLQPAVHRTRRICRACKFHLPLPSAELGPGSPLAAHTFADAELQSLLTGLDSGRCDLDGLLGGLGHSASLQFLPHPDEEPAARQAAALFVPTDLTGPGLPLPLPALPGEAGGFGLTLPSGADQQEQQQQRQQRQSTRQARQQDQQQDQQQAQPPSRPARSQGQRPGRGAASAAAARAAASAAAAAKQPHSQVEKQRRDRINNLIDEVRPGGGWPKFAAPKGGLQRAPLC